MWLEILVLSIFWFCCDSDSSLAMDVDINVRRNRFGRLVSELLVLPDVDISEPETDSD